MSIVIWLLAGGLVGWTASYYMTTTRPEAVAFNVTVAALGAAFAGWVVGPMLDAGLGLGFIVSVCGGAALLFCVHCVQRTMAR